MSASNFMSKNTNKVYSFGLEMTEDETDYFQIELENLQDEIISDLKNELKIEGVKIYEDNRYDNERNYSGHIFGNILIEDNTEEEKNINIDLITRSGYYNGVNFDYEYSIYNTYGDDDIPKNLQEKFDKCIDIIEKSYDKFTLALRRVATFSNGETIYEPVKK